MEDVVRMAGYHSVDLGVFIGRVLVSTIDSVCGPLLSLRVKLERGYAIPIWTEHPPRLRPVIAVRLSNV